MPQVKMEITANTDARDDKYGPVSQEDMEANWKNFRDEIDDLVKDPTYVGLEIAIIADASVEEARSEDGEIHSDWVKEPNDAA